MGLFDFGKNKGTTATAEANTASDNSGFISLEKDDIISLDKTSSGTIVAENGWKAKGKDYDLKALVRYKNGDLIYIGAANKDERLSTPDGAVRHGGDVTVPGEREKITITWNENIASIALSSYSALSNGTGSFREYGVYVNIINGPQTIGISAADASAESTSYTLCFGEVTFEPGGSFSVRNLELYSRRGSERRVGYRGDKVVMDLGPEGKNK